MLDLYDAIDNNCIHMHIDALIYCDVCSVVSLLEAADQDGEQLPDGAGEQVPAAS